MSLRDPRSGEPTSILVSTVDDFTTMLLKIRDSGTALTLKNLLFRLTSESSVSGVGIWLSLVNTARRAITRG